MTTVPSPPLVDPAPKTPPSTKVILSAVGAFVAPTVLILLDYLLGEGRGVFAGLPVWLQIVVFSLATSGSALIAGYLKRDPIREAGARALAASR